MTMTESELLARITRAIDGLTVWTNDGLTVWPSARELRRALERRGLVIISEADLEALQNPRTDPHPRSGSPVQAVRPLSDRPAELPAGCSLWHDRTLPPKP